MAAGKAVYLHAAMVPTYNLLTVMFEIRSYTKLELARLYRADTPKDESAVELFRRDVRRCRDLMGELRKLPSYNVNAKHYPAAQVAVIVDFLGEP